jgi:hypothetical protein
MSAPSMGATSGQRVTSSARPSIGSEGEAPTAG